MKINCEDHRCFTEKSRFQFIKYFEIQEALFMLHNFFIFDAILFVQSQQVSLLHILIVHSSRY